MPGFVDLARVECVKQTWYIVTVVHLRHISHINSPRGNTMRQHIAAATATAVAIALAPNASAIVRGPHIADHALANAATAVTRTVPAEYGQPSATDRAVADTIAHAKPALRGSADDYRARRGLAPLGHAPALDVHAQQRADQLAAQSRALAVPTSPVWESIVFVPDLSLIHI